MAEEIYIARQDTLMDTKAELTEVNTKIGTTANTGGTATAGTVMGKLNNLTSGAATHAAAWTAARATKIDTMDTNVSSVKTSVGATTDTGGSATAGTLMGKLNALVTSLSTHMGRWTAARATKVDTIDTNVTDIKTSVGTASDTGGNTLFGTLKDLNKKSAGGVETFTTDGSFTVPENVTLINVTAAGGGGGGGKSPGGSGGSGGACIADKTFAVTPGQTIAITIGKGGAGAQAGSQGADATSGGATVVGGLVTLPGGAAGILGSKMLSANNGGGYGGCAGTNGGIGVIGACGATGAGGQGGGTYSTTDTIGKTTNYRGGGGGGGSYGKGGQGAHYDGGKGNSGTYGGGGGGGGGKTGTYFAGGAGGDGIVIIKWGSAI